MKNGIGKFFKWQNISRLGILILVSINLNIFITPDSKIALPPDVKYYPNLQILNIYLVCSLVSIGWHFTKNFSLFNRLMNLLFLITAGLIISKISYLVNLIIEKVDRSELVLKLLILDSSVIIFSVFAILILFAENILVLFSRKSKRENILDSD